MRLPLGGPCHRGARAGLARGPSMLASVAQHLVLRLACWPGSRRGLCAVCPEHCYPLRVAARRCCTPFVLARLEGSLAYRRATKSPRSSRLLLTRGLFSAHRLSPLRPTVRPARKPSLET